MVNVYNNSDMYFCDVNWSFQVKDDLLNFMCIIKEMPEKQIMVDFIVLCQLQRKISRAQRIAQLIHCFMQVCISCLNHFSV